MGMPERTTNAGSELDDARPLHRRALADFGHLVHCVGDRWDAATPCEEWNVRQLVAHVTGEQYWVEPLLDGLTLLEAAEEIPGDPLGDDPGRAWDDGAHSAALAFAAEDALECTVHLSYGDTPARSYLGEMTSDLVIHGWDLARGI